MKCFLQLTIFGLLALSIAATPYSRIRRQATFTTSEGRDPTFIGDDFAGFDQFQPDQDYSLIGEQPENGLTNGVRDFAGGVFNSGFEQRQQQDQARALNNLFVRDQRQTPNDFVFPQEFPSSTTTGRPATGRTTLSPQFLSCLEGCPSANQYNPVCGSDGQTYHNEYRLDCARRCGSLVEMVRAGTCLPLTAGK